MKIEEVKKLDDGVSGITTEGEIIKAPNKPRESQYGWSQFIVLKDDTAEVGSNINIENAEEAYKIGQYIKIKGKISHYKSRGKPCLSINGNVIDEIVQVEKVSQEKPVESEKKSEEEPVEKQEKDMNKVWEEKDLRIARECAIKAVTELSINGRLIDSDYFGFANTIVDYIYNGLKITSEAITKEFGGTVVEEKPEEGEKEQKIAQAKELVRNPHLAEPVDDTMATVKQKKLIYGYIDADGKKIKGMLDSQYIKKGEVKNIGKAQDLTKANAIKYYDYWYGEDGERNKRELEAKEKEGSPFATKREPIEKRDPKDDTSLTKDLLIEEINKLRKAKHLEDDEKFSEAFECNANFELWTEKELNSLKEKLEMWKPNWVTGK